MQNSQTDLATIAERTPLAGILNVDKPAGPSSAAIVRKIKHLLPPKTKIGHAGTLDPFATGVLLILIGKATKLSESLMNQPKSYLTTVKFGATTPTDDPTSPQTPIPNIQPVPLATVTETLKSFVGTISQRPSSYSAMKIGGRRAYDLAREGKPVDLAPRLIRIDTIEIMQYEWPHLTLRVDCGRGTYIRALARDLGEALKVGGHLTSLRRTKVGSFTIDCSVTLEQLTAQGIRPFLNAP